MNLGRSVLGSAGFKFSERSLSSLTATQIFLSAETAPTVTDLAKLIPENLCPNLGVLHVEAAEDRQ